MKYWGGTRPGRRLEQTPRGGTSLPPLFPRGESNHEALSLCGKKAKQTHWPAKPHRLRSVQGGQGSSGGLLVGTWCFHCKGYRFSPWSGAKILCTTWHSRKRKAMINLDSVLKSRDVTLPTKVHLVKAMVFPVVMYGCESWTIKKAEC